MKIDKLSMISSLGKGAERNGQEMGQTRNEKWDRLLF